MEITKLFTLNTFISYIVRSIVMSVKPQELTPLNLDASR